MEDICYRFPHLSKAIFKQIDNQSLNRCKKVSRIFRTAIDNQKFNWIKIIQKYAGTIEKSWEIVLHKIPFDIVKELALATQKFYEVRPSRNKHQWSPLHIAAERGHLSLCKFVINKISQGYVKLVATET